MSADVLKICQAAKSAAYDLAGFSTEQKNAMLSAISRALNSRCGEILDANDIDVENCTGRDASFVDRLTLNEKRVNTMFEGVEQIIALPDPVGEIAESWQAKNGLKLNKVRAPLGVIAIIYEARPNVTVDAAALCIKSGNAVVLRGSRDAINSNRALYRVMSDALKGAGFPSGCIGFIDDESRETQQQLLSLDKYIDVVIPRGGEGLKNFVLQNAKMPVIASAGGNNHIYVEKTADLDAAKNIAVNAKISRPSTCNAAEHLLVDAEIAEDFLPLVLCALRGNGVELSGCGRTRAICDFVSPLSERDFETEFFTLKMSVKVVDGIKDAVSHINAYGTKHSEAIVTKSKKAAEYFSKNVDAACTYINASTRFTDGFEFGLGAEMGISTQKLHARGPVALKELTSLKYVVYGDGHIRG